MSQIGMQMPGRQRTKAPTINAYTGLMLCAVACLGVALVLVGQAAMTVGPEGGPMDAIKLHGSNLQLND